MLQYFGLDSSLIEKIADVNEDKYGCFTPGTQIPIVPEEIALQENPDYFLVLPWHFKDFFLNNPKFFGKNLVFPLPRLEIIKPK